jgi:hypothetical protein
MEQMIVAGQIWMMERWSETKAAAIDFPIPPLK